MVPKIFAIVSFVFIARGRSSTVYVERTVSAPAERVWKLWNEPESIKKWWGPKDKVGFRSIFILYGSDCVSWGSFL